MRHLALLGLLSATALASLGWQIEGPARADAAGRPVLVCPLGTHGLAPDPFPRVASGGAGRVLPRP